MGNCIRPTPSSTDEIEKNNLLKSEPDSQTLLISVKELLAILLKKCCEGDVMDLKPYFKKEKRNLDKVGDGENRDMYLSNLLAILKNI